MYLALSLICKVTDVLVELTKQLYVKQGDVPFWGHDIYLADSL